MIIKLVQFVVIRLAHLNRASFLLIPQWDIVLIVVDLELKKSELTAEIVQVESELESKTGELDEVRKLLGEGSVEEVYESEYDDEDFREDEIDPEEEDEDEEEPAEPDDEGYDDFEEGDDEEDTPDGNEELLAKEKKLSEEVLVLQMRLVALNKQLNDIVAQEGLETYVEQEE